MKKTLLAAISVTLLACNAQGGPALAPSAPTYSAAVGAASCADANGPFAPLTLDLSNEARGDLEVVARQGLAIVRFDCGHFEVLNACHPKGEYGFVGFTKKEEVLHIENELDLRAVLPLGQARLAGSMERGSALDVGLAMVGKRAATAASLRRDQLDGDCAGATHFVRAMTVGAFAMATGAHGKVKTVAEVFVASAEANASDVRQRRTKDGSLDACATASPTDVAPPAQCGGVLRIELIPIGRSPGTFETVASTRSCRYGLEEACTSECSAGDSTSCTVLGHMRYNGAGVPLDRVAARSLYEGACKNGVADACASAGNLHYLGEGGYPVDKSQAAALYVRACAEGSAVGCDSVGNLYFLGEGGYPVDRTKAVAAYRRACDGGASAGCASVGNIYYLGADGIAVDKVAALKFYRRACDGGSADGCESVGNLYYLGEGGLRADKASALGFYRTSCALGSKKGCDAAHRAE